MASSVTVLGLLSELASTIRERDEARECARHLADKMATWMEVEEGPEPVHVHECESCDRLFDNGIANVLRCKECSVANAVCVECCPFKLTHGHVRPYKRQRLFATATGREEATSE